MVISELFFGTSNTTGQTEGSSAEEKGGCTAEETDDKAKDLPAKVDLKVENLRNELAIVEIQAEENRRRVLVLQSEWQALYDKAGRERTTRLMLSLPRAPIRMEWMIPTKTR